MSEIPNLHEYRNERIKKVSKFVLDTVHNHLYDRVDGEFIAVLGKVDTQQIELFVMPDGFDSGLSTAPEYVLNEVAIDLANALTTEDSLPYKVDMTFISSDMPHILIKKI